MPEEAAIDFRRRIPDIDPPYLYPDYVGTRLRAPSRPLVVLSSRLTELSGPLLGASQIGELDHDLTRQHAGDPQGQRIIVHGRVVGPDGRPVRNSLVEIWQANAAGRYRHAVDTHPAPLDPSFSGAGRTTTDDDGRYRFITVKPGAYPWNNHPNAWRPAHIHFSLFGRNFTQRLITQMYFPDDPLFELDPVFNSISDATVRERLISRFDLSQTVPEWALAFEWDIVLGGRSATPSDEDDD
jgi:protocatechuate 3,4-dioxygenase, beta subunit